MHFCHAYFGFAWIKEHWYASPESFINVVSCKTTFIDVIGVCVTTLTVYVQIPLSSPCLVTLRSPHFQCELTESHEVQSVTLIKAEPG